MQKPVYSVESLMKNLSISSPKELSEKLNIQKTTVDKWMQRGVPAKIWRDFGQNVENPNVLKIPVFEALAGCGATGMAEQLHLKDENFVFDSRIFPSDIVTKNIAMIRIVGDSMAPYLDENDWALIELRNGRTIEPIEAVYLIEYEGSVQIKRVQVIGKKAIIKSDNKEYSPFELKINEFDIVGKIVARLKFGSPMLVRG